MQNIHNILQKLKVGNTTFLLLAATGVGILSGLGNIAFVTITEYSHHFFFEIIGEKLFLISEGGFHLLFIPVILLIGAIILIPLSLLFPGLVNGYGFPKFLEEIHLKMAKISSLRLLANTFAAAITIGSGGSAGREGPIAQIGGTIGSIASRTFKLSARRKQVLIGCGVAGAVAATFNAPIAGVLFAEEIVFMGEMKLNNFSLFVISSVTATAVSRIYYGAVSIFQVPDYTFNSMKELLLYALLGIAIGIISALFTRSYYFVKQLFDNINLHRTVKPLIGAVLVGCIGIFLPEILGDGYHFIQKTISGEALPVSAMVLAIIVIVKILATSTTLGSGGAGGLFAPSMYIGAVLGRVFGDIFRILFPSLNISPGAYSVVGMGALLAAATHAPLTAIFLLLELTSNYHVILPILLASIIGITVSQKLFKESIDSYYFKLKNIPMEGAKEAFFLKHHQVSEIMEPKTTSIPEGATIAMLIDKLQEHQPSHFPVTDNDGKVVGIVPINSLKSFMFQQELWNLVLVTDLMVDDYFSSNPCDNLYSVQNIFDIHDLDDMPVIDSDQKLTGFITRHSMVKFLRKQMLLHHSHEAPISEI